MQDDSDWQQSWANGSGVDLKLLRFRILLNIQLIQNGGVKLKPDLQYQIRQYNQELAFRQQLVKATFDYCQLPDIQSLRSRACYSRAVMNSDSLVEL